VAEHELDGRRASAGVPEHGGALDAERIEEQRVRVRLVRGMAAGGREDPRYPKREGATNR
jgi:hypothetical protein